MKKTIKLLAVVMVIAMLAISLVSCGNVLNGTYEKKTESQVLGADITFEFKGKEYTKTTVSYVAGFASDPDVEKGTYKILEDPENADNLLIVFTPEGAENGQSYSYSTGTLNGQKIIVIGGTTYTKAD